MIGVPAGKDPRIQKPADSSGTPTMKSRDTFASGQSKHPAEAGLRDKHGRWEYRFNFKGKPYSQVTDLEAVAGNVLKAQALKEAHLDQLRSGKVVVRQVSVPLSDAVDQFMLWYRSEHPRGGKCKWAQALMSSFQFYNEQTKCALDKIGPAELEAFKMWRRSTGIHDNTLHKQLLLVRAFFGYARKRGWIKGDPFARGEDMEVKIPSEQDSTAMRVLSLEEESKYLTAAKLESIDLFDVATIMKEQGPRPDEIMSLQQTHVDLFNRHFTIWDNSAEGKSKNAHRKLRMTDATFHVFARRLSQSGLWVFPSPKNDGPRTTLQKSHERTVERSKVKCRLYDMRHTFATRFALAGGLLPVLSRILGHADLAMLNKYIHPSQDDMDRAMDWFSTVRPTAPALTEMLIDFENGNVSKEGWPGPTFGPTMRTKQPLKRMISPKSSAGRA